MNMYRATRWVVSVLIASLATAGLHAANARVYVKFVHGQKAAARAAVAQAGGTVKHEFDDLDTVAVALPEQARSALQHNPNVALLEDDPVREFLTVDLPAQTVPYGITMVQAPSITAAATDAKIKVGVIDSGVYAAHPDFAGLALTGTSVSTAGTQGAWDRDYLSHGTHVVGTIAAANNSIGVVGVSPTNVAIHMVKVFGDDGTWIYSSDLLAAAKIAANAGCKIISMSLGGAVSSNTEKQGLAALYANNILLVAAAGNDGTNKFSYPASYDSVMSVAAIDSGKAVASFSQKNSQVEIAAPGVGVLSTVSYFDSTSLTVNSALYDATHIDLSAQNQTVSNTALVYGGLGTTTDPAWNGKIVLLDRGTNSFYEKVHNVQLSGGVACVIANNVAGGFAGTLGDGNTSTIVGVTISQEAGTAIKAVAAPSATVSNTYSQPASAYDYFDGTSMATPHVAGVAALIWSKYPGATNVQIRNALDSTAEDLGAAGRDPSYGYGLVRAQNALTTLAAINPPPPPPPADTTVPVISNVVSNVTNPKKGSFEITWITDDASTSDVIINGTTYADSTLTTSHRRTFRAAKGKTYSGSVMSTNASGLSSSEPFPGFKL